MTWRIGVYLGSNLGNKNVEPGLCTFVFTWMYVESTKNTATITWYNKKARVTSLLAHLSWNSLSTPEKTLFLKNLSFFSITHCRDTIIILTDQ